jgi:hypothetical protein
MDLFHFVHQQQQNVTVKNDQNVFSRADPRSSNSIFIIDFAVMPNTLCHRHHHVEFARYSSAGSQEATNVLSLTTSGKIFNAEVD